jgi:hypothetical protein
VHRRAKPSRTEIERSRQLRRLGRGAGRLGDLQHTGVGVDASGVHSRSEGLEVCLTRRRGVERFKPSGGIEKEQRTVAAASEHKRDLRA